MADVQDQPTILVEVRDGVGYVTLDRPWTINALTPQLLRELDAALRSLERDPDVRVVVLRGAGRGFSSGWDRGPDGAVADARSALVSDAAGRDVMNALSTMRTTLTVATLHGATVGGGVLLAAGCDVRLAADDAYFWLPEISFGNPLLWTGVAPLVREIGLSRTRYLALTSQRVDATWALSAGLVHEVHPTDHLAERVDALCTTLRDLPVRGVHLMKDDLTHHATLSPHDHGHAPLTVLDSLTAESFTH